ncbi:MAG: 5-deoxy-glucuronate isomerase [Castellaniella sp.]|uniref:5-deoxy-glucuronate isomerase n=1 Tax=Castellaniella hirudinis TaxID=1144617 RepID=A0ABV8S3Y3_9BURK
MKSLLHKATRTGKDIVAITPEEAGWKYVGFQAQRLSPGESTLADAGAGELCIVVLTGTVDIQVGAEHFTGLGRRASVFEEIPPAAVYVTTGASARITAATSAEVAFCRSTRGNPAKKTQCLDPAAMRRSVRGEGSNQRFVCDILPQDDPRAESLLVVEVVTPAGHSSSYPPHKHDTDNVPHETRLEETYYHRINPSQGFAFQRVYTDDRSLDETMSIENHDLVAVPRGYHPCVAPHGYDLYYLNVMAGSERHWVFKNDPAHEWMIAPAKV